MTIIAVLYVLFTRWGVYLHERGMRAALSIVRRGRLPEKGDPDEIAEHS